MLRRFTYAKKIPIVFVFLLFTTYASIAAPTLKSLGLRQSESYVHARDKLLKQGWTLDQKGFPEGPDYRLFPEVVCGRGYDAVCSVRFQKSGIHIMLYVTDHSGRLTVKDVYDDS
jgi:hypothetical protein